MAQPQPRYPEFEDRESAALAPLPSQSPAYQAFRILQFAFVVAPIVAGLDKFLYLLVNWDQYLAPMIARVLPVQPQAFMMAVGVVEIVAGLLVALIPRVGGWVVAAWLCGIVVNLMMVPGYYDIALRDLGLALAAVALARLAWQFREA